jgi:sugar lactone lactonase YvrE
MSQSDSALSRMNEARRLGDKLLDHPESVAVGPDGRLYAGGELGQVYAVGLDDSVVEVANTGGDILALAFDGNGRLYVCDRGLKTVVQLDLETKEIATYSSGTPGRPMFLPNYLCFDDVGRLYVTDSGWRDRPSGCVYTIEPGGATSMWWSEPSWITNGCALNQDGDALYLVESFGRRLVRIPILPDRTAGQSEVVLDLSDTIPDGLAFAADGSLFISLYRPDAILRWDGGEVDTFVADPHGLTLCAPTNVAFHNQAGLLVSANLCSRHLTTVPVDVPGLPLRYPVLPC